MINVEAFRQMVFACRAQIERAQSLNNRGGKFPVPSLSQHFARCLEMLGALSLAEVNPELLALPPLDETEVARIELESPSFISVAGITVPVTYSSYQAPAVHLSQTDMESVWRNLPESLVLPNGRDVHLYFQDRFGYTRGGSVADARSALMSGYVSAMIDKWQSDMPDSFRYERREGDQPALEEFFLGKHPLTGESVMGGRGWSWSYGSWAPSVGSLEDARLAQEQGEKYQRDIRAKEAAVVLVARMEATGLTKTYGSEFYDLYNYKPYGDEGWAEWSVKAVMALDKYDAKQAQIAAAKEVPAVQMTWAAQESEYHALKELDAREGQGAIVLDGKFFPGDLQVIGFRKGSGGGVRYSAEITLTEGVDVAATSETAGKRYDLFVHGVGRPGWRVAWKHLKDGEVYSRSLATAAGITTIYEDGYKQCVGWDGFDGGPSVSEVQAAHGLVSPAPAPKAEPKPVIPVLPAGPALDSSSLAVSLTALQSKFGGNKQQRR